jgi:hypothetical protein
MALTELVGDQIARSEPVPQRGSQHAARARADDRVHLVQRPADPFL